MQSLFGLLVLLVALSAVFVLSLGLVWLAGVRSAPLDFIAALILTVIITCVPFVLVAELHGAGYCFRESRFFSDEELLDRAETALSRKPLYPDWSNFQPYQSLDDFRQQNPNCCWLASQTPRVPDDQRQFTLPINDSETEVGFLDKLSGFPINFLEGEYDARFTGGRPARRIDVRGVRISSCGEISARLD